MSILSEPSAQHTCCFRSQSSAFAGRPFCLLSSPRQPNLVQNPAQIQRSEPVGKQLKLPEAGPMYFNACWYSMRAARSLLFLYRLFPTTFLREAKNSLSDGIMLSDTQKQCGVLGILQLAASPHFLLSISLKKHQLTGIRHYRSHFLQGNFIFDFGVWGYTDPEGALFGGQAPVTECKSRDHPHY